MKALGIYLSIEGIGPRLGDMPPSSRTRLELFHVVAYSFEFGFLKVCVGFVVQCTCVRGGRRGEYEPLFCLECFMCVFCLEYIGVVCLWGEMA